MCPKTKTQSPAKGYCKVAKGDNSRYSGYLVDHHLVSVIARVCSRVVQFEYANFRLKMSLRCHYNVIQVNKIKQNKTIPTIIVSHVFSLLQRCSNIIQQWRSQLDNWGGPVFIYSSNSPLLISFEIDYFYGV